MPKKLRKLKKGKKHNKIRNQIENEQSQSALKRAKRREKAAKILEKELSLMKKERINKARQEGRELSPAELKEWELKEKELREKFIREQYKIYTEGEDVPEIDSEVERIVELKIPETDIQEKFSYLPGTAGPDGISYQGSWPLNYIDEKVSVRAEKSSGSLYDINAVVITGDRDSVLSLRNWADYENDALYSPMSDADVENFRKRLLKDLQDEGFVFATVSVYKRSLNLGFLKFRVHVGQKGNVNRSRKSLVQRQTNLGCIFLENRRTFQLSGTF